MYVYGCYSLYIYIFFISDSHNQLLPVKLRKKTFIFLNN